VAVATGEFAQNVSDLASSDVGKQLAQSLNGLADVERISQDIHNIQAEQDITTLMATGILGYSSSSIHSNDTLRS
jgi:sorting nexin-1/2